VIRSLLEIDARHVPLTPRAIECTSTRCARGRESWSSVTACQNNAWRMFQERGAGGGCILHCESRCGKPTTAAQSTAQACAKHVINARHRYPVTLNSSVSPCIPYTMVRAIVCVRTMHSLPMALPAPTVWYPPHTIQHVQRVHCQLRRRWNGGRNTTVRLLCAVEVPHIDATEATTAATLHLDNPAIVEGSKFPDQYANLETVRELQLAI
jgi:hypothetical protein